MPFSVYTRINVLKALFNNTAYPLPATVYFALLVTNPTDDSGTGLVEASYAGYARQGLTANTTNFPAPSGGTTSPQQVASGTIVNFPTPATNVTVTGIAVYDAVTAGNFLLWMPLGVLSPANAPVATPSNTGGTLTAAASPYAYAYTYTGTNGGETTPSPDIAATIASGAAGSVALSGIAALPAGASGVKIYKQITETGAWGLIQTQATNANFTDTGVALGAAPPDFNTTNLSQLVAANTAISIPVGNFLVQE